MSWLLFMTVYALAWGIPTGITTAIGSLLFPKISFSLFVVLGALASWPLINYVSDLQPDESGSLWWVVYFFCLLTIAISVPMLLIEYLRYRIKRLRA
jgi:hypothetical protein